MPGDEAGTTTGGGADTAPAAGGNGASPTTTTGGGAAAPDTGGTRAEGAAGTEAGPPVAAPKAALYKFKRGGKEVEAPIEDVLRYAGDDGEHEFTAGGKQHRVRYPDLVRHAQLGVGALERMQQAKEAQERYSQVFERGKRDTEWLLETHLGVPDATEWAIGVAHKRMVEDSELLKLQQENPYLYQQRMQQRANAQAERKRAFEDEQRKGQDEHKAAQQAEYEAARSIAEAMRGLGLPQNRRLGQMAREIWQQYRDVGYAVEPGQVAAAVRDAWHQDLYGYLDGMDEDRLADWLGDDRRRKLREIELKRLKGGAAAKPAEPVAPARKKPGNAADDEGMTANQWLRSKGWA